MFAQTIRFRLTSALALILLGAATLVMALLPSRVYREQVDALHERILGAAVVAAHDLGPVVSDPQRFDAASVRRIVESIQEVRGVVEVDFSPLEGESLFFDFEPAADPLLQEGLTPPAEWVTGVSPDGSSYQVYFPVRVDGEARVFLRILASMAEVEQYVAGQQRQILGGVLSLAMILLATTWGLGHVVTRPLRRISETAEEIATGEVGLRANEAWGGEVGALARSFNHMVSRLESAQSAALSASRHLERILANVPAGIVLLDHDLEIVFLNEAVIADPVRRALAPGRTPRQILGGANAAAADSIHEMLVRCLETGSDTEAEVRLRVEGGCRSVVVRATRLDDVASEPRVLICALDVSGLRETEEALRDTESELRQAQKMEAVGRLAGGVAHDFNNLLTVIAGQAHFAELELDDAHPAFESVEEIREAAERASRLTRQLLAFSRRQVLAPKRLEVNEVIGGISRLLERLLGEDIRLDLQLADGLPGVEADPGQLEQVLMNLTVNARDAMPAGGHIRIRTGTGPTVEGTATVRISVEDDGVGMDEQTQALIFEPFFTTKEVGSGTGLGLSTVYGIIQQSGGEISVRSAPDEGATFHVDLPAVQPQEPRRPSPPLPTAHPAGGVDRPALQILLVEDEPMVRSLILRQLTRLGHRVSAAEDPRVALERLASGQVSPDLLLTDVVMPGMSGVEFSQVVRETMPGLPVLFMTGYAEQELIRVGLDREKVRLLTKPFTYEQLAEAIDEVLARPAGPQSPLDRPRAAADPARRPVAQAQRKL